MYEGLYGPPPRKQTQMTWSDLAEAGYRAYAVHLNTVLESPLPCWTVLQPHIKEAWQLAAKQIVIADNLIGAENRPSIVD
jgi:hypothetical protein